MGGMVALVGIAAWATPANSSPLPSPLPDPDDGPFLEIGMAANTECLVTGNPKHFPVKRMGSIPVLSPAEFLDLYRKRRKMG